MMARGTFQIETQHREGAEEGSVGGPVCLGHFNWEGGVRGGGHSRETATAVWSLVFQAEDGGLPLLGPGEKGGLVRDGVVRLEGHLKETVLVLFGTCTLTLYSDPMVLPLKKKI